MVIEQYSPVKVGKSAPQPCFPQKQNHQSESSNRPLVAGTKNSAYAYEMLFVGVRFL